MASDKGRAARVTFRGTLLRPGRPAVHGATIEAEAAKVLADVAAEPFVMRRAPSGMRTQTLALCEAAGFTPTIDVEADDLPHLGGPSGQSAQLLAMYRTLAPLLRSQRRMSTTSI